MREEFTMSNLTRRNIFSKFFDNLNSSKNKKSKIFSDNILLHNTGKPVWTNRNYNKFADEGYVKNVIAYRSINMIAEAASSVKMKLHFVDEDSRYEIKQHPLLKILERPNPCIGGSDFIESIVSYRLISGNVYIQAITNTSNEVKELHILRPDRVQVIAGDNCIPMGYRYSVKGNNSNEYLDFPVDSITGKSEILHIKNFNPLNDWYGLSPIEAAAYSIDQHNYSASWNQALLQNGARPSGALVVKGDNSLSEDQFNRLKNQVSEEFSGHANAGRPILLEGGLEWKEMSISPKDMDFMNIKNTSARDIALAFGVPPQLLGIQGDNTYNNLAEARLALWEQTVIAHLNDIADALNNWLVPAFDARLKLSFDIDSVSALAPRREALWNKITSASFLSDDEKRKILNI